MLDLKIEDLLKATGGKLVKGHKEEIIKEIVIDSRQAKEDSLFVCLEGQNFDGHDFIDQAIGNGCKAFLVHKDIKIEGVSFIRVANTQLAYGDIARYYRFYYEKKLNKPLIVVGITGSVGKTSTKDLVYECLRTKYRTLKSSLNENNEIGLPKTILKIHDEEALVVEMGMRGLGQIEYLGEIGRPNFALISNIGSSHLELLGSMENVLKAKTEIANTLIGNRVLCINGDDPLLKIYTFGKDIDLLSFGFDESNDFRGEIIDENSFTLYDPQGKSHIVSLSLKGRHNMYNALGAISLAYKCGVPIEDAIEACMAYKGDKIRQNIFSLKKMGLEIISDTYNASYESMIASIDVLTSLKGDRRIAVLGDMLELGDFSRKYHEKLATYLIEKDIDIVLAVGKESKIIYDIVKVEKRSLYAKDSIEGYDKLIEIIEDGDRILVKGSNAMKMDYIVKRLIEEEDLR